MPKDRFFVGEILKPNSTVHLTEDEHHHLKVMRAKPGENLEVVNGQGQLAQGCIEAIGKHSTTVAITSPSPPAEPPRPLILAQALLRPKNLDLVIEKGTELGATAFWLFPGDRSEKITLKSAQLERLRSITIAALKQCGRLYLPSLTLLPPLKAWKETPPGALFFGDLTSNMAFKPQIGPTTTLFIGPEKGFSPEEEEFLRNSFNANGICLNPNILRAETAALCALAIAASTNIK